jgi:hypothetical protein
MLRCLAALAILPLCAQDSYVGAPVCGKCHPAQSRAQAATGHAHALGPAAAHRLADSFTAALTRTPRFRFEMSPKAVRIADEKDVLDVPLEWAFGAGAQAVTFVSRANHELYLEHYFTYYTALHSMAPTPGQRDLQPQSLAEAAGLLYKTLDPKAGMIGCFECHSTGPVAAEAGHLKPRELGVRCEACHGPGSAHVASGGRASLRLNVSPMNEMCGRCHRPPASDPAQIDWNYPWNVRHQPVYLSQSACFQKSRGALSCVTCHDPHAPLRTSDAAHYDARCATCHKATPATCRPACAGCHLPTVTPEPPLRFTNHWIGVYGEGAKLRPLKRQP